MELQTYRGDEDIAAIYAALGNPANVTAAQMAILSSILTGLPRTAAVVLTGGTDTGGGLGAWQVPAGDDVIILRSVADIITPATSACTIKVGTTPTNATTVSANLIDTADVHTAAVTLDNITDKGTNGKSRQRAAAGTWVTFSTGSGASAALAGKGYITYIKATI